MLRVRAMAGAILVNPVARAMTGHQGCTVVTEGDGALVCHHQGFGEPLAVVLRAECVRRLRARLLPGDHGVVVRGQHGVYVETGHGRSRLSGSNGAKMYANASSLLDIGVVTAVPTRIMCRFGSHDRPT